MGASPQGHGVEPSTGQVREPEKNAEDKNQINTLADLEPSDDDDQNWDFDELSAAGDAEPSLEKSNDLATRFGSDAQSNIAAK